MDSWDQGATSNVLLGDLLSRLSSFCFRHIFSFPPLGNLLLVYISFFEFTLNVTLSLLVGSSLPSLPEKLGNIRILQSGELFLENFTLCLTIEQKGRWWPLWCSRILK